MNIEESLKLIPERLRELEKTLDVTKTELAEKAGMSRSFYSNVATGAQLPSFDFLVKICKAFDVSAEWLIFGKGQMFARDNEFLSGIDPKMKDYYTQLIEAIESLELKEQVKILRAIDAILDIPEKED